MTKLELKSSHEVIDTVDVADVDSIFQGKPTDPDILTVVMKDGTRLYCDEVCPINSLQEEPKDKCNGCNNVKGCITCVDWSEWAHLKEASKNYADKENFRKEVEKLKSNLIYGACSSQVAMETRCKEEAYDEVISLLDSLQEEPVSEDYKKARKEAMFSINEQKGYSFKLQDMFDAGANWREQQLMKKAIEGIVTTNIDGWINVMTGFIRPEEAGANFGNKVKVIIIKEEGV